MKRITNDFHGWIILDKPQGLTSTQALGKIKRILNVKKAGHAGTLDPLATGLLPLALGEATKTVPFMVDGQKGYRFTVAWGAQSSTDDSEGEIIARSDYRPSRDDIVALLPAFMGTIAQIPPQFSAIKLDGHRAYDLARQGIELDLKSRDVSIARFELLEHSAERSVFEVECSKGTYVRSLARDMGQALGCYGMITALRRTQVGSLKENDAIPLAEIEDLVHKGAWNVLFERVLRPLSVALDDIPAVSVERADAARLKAGQAVIVRGRDAPLFEGMVSVTCGGSLLALAEFSEGAIHPRRVFAATKNTAPQAPIEQPAA